MNFKKNNIVVIGDIMIDRTILGKVTRISPEAPVPIVNYVKENDIIGGAGNVAANIVSLGGKATYIGVVGKDKDKHKVLSCLEDVQVNHRLFDDESRPTIVKARIWSVDNNQQMLRIDTEKTHPIIPSLENSILEAVKEFEASVIVLSDYNKGSLTPNIFRKVIEYGKENNIMVIIDPKPQNIQYCKGAFMITPNHVEACKFCQISQTNKDEDILKIGSSIQKELACNVLITRGAKGMTLFRENAEPFRIETVAQEVFDVTGAGDTVTATLSLCLANGYDLEESCKIANKAAGLVVGVHGTTKLKYGELFNE